MLTLLGDSDDGRGHGDSKDTARNHAHERNGRIGSSRGESRRQGRGITGTNHNHARGGGSEDK
jgi:hypothetical protein